MTLLKIRDWDANFENAASRKLKRLDWVAVPNKTDGEGYTALVDHPNAAAHLGAWYAIVEAASKQTPRGFLPRGIPQDVGGICRSLGRMSRLPASIFQEVIPRLLEIGWLENVAESADEVAESADEIAEPDAIVAAQGRELQGTTGNRNTQHVLRDMPAWKRDEQFVRFTVDYLSTGGAFIDQDFSDAFQFCWKVLDFEQKLERIAALNKHSEEYHSDPRFVPKPLRFLQSEWERPIRPKVNGNGARSRQQDNADAWSRA